MFYAYNLIKSLHQLFAELHGYINKSRDKYKLFLFIKSNEQRNQSSEKLGKLPKTTHIEWITDP